MPGEQGSYDLIRTKDERSNSKADTFFIAPKGLGNSENQVQSLHLQALTGDVTGSQRVETLAGSNLSISGNALTVASSAVYSDEKAQDAVGNNVDSTLSYDDVVPSFGVADGAIGTQQLNTPFADLTALHDTPVAVGASDLRLNTGQSIEDGSGVSRILLSSSGTRIENDAGERALTATNADRTRLFARSDEPVQIYDEKSSSPAVTYTTSASSPGTLELTNADLDANSNDIKNVGSVSTEEESITGPRTVTETVQAFDSNADDTAGLFLDATGIGDVEIAEIIVVINGNGGGATNPVDLTINNVTSGYDYTVEKGASLTQFSNQSKYQFEVFDSTTTILKFLITDSAALITQQVGQDDKDKITSGTNPNVTSINSVRLTSSFNASGRIIVKGVTDS